jgi:raffinose/stachyose/melibiose transport system permease protein
VHKAKVCKAAIYFVLSILFLVNLFPFWWVLNTSFRDNTAVFTNTLGLPDSLNFENYIKAWDIGNFRQYFVNTFITVALTLLICIIFASMAAYVSARIWKSVFLYGFLSLGLMVPTHVLLIPEKVILQTLNLTQSRLGITLVYIAVNFSFSFFIIYTSMLTVPKELEEAAAIDGASRVRTFFTIVLPIVKPGLATASVMLCYTAWNEYLLPLCIVTNNNLKMLSQGLNELKGQYGMDYGLMTAGIVITVIPIVLIYTFLQKYIVAGVTSGAVKG